MKVEYRVEMCVEPRLDARDSGHWELKASYTHKLQAVDCYRILQGNKQKLPVRIVRRTERIVLPAKVKT